jgi:hypothetical protein
MKTYEMTNRTNNQKINAEAINAFLKHSTSITELTSDNVDLVNNLIKVANALIISDVDDVNIFEQERLREERQRLVILTWNFPKPC